MVRQMTSVLVHMSIILTFFFPFRVSATMVQNTEKVDLSFWERSIEFLTHPIVIPILLTIGFLGFIVELFTPRFGIPGMVGILAFMLYFYSHLVAGFASIGTIGLFVVGVVLILLELVLPGGIIGIFGFASVLASFFLSAQSFTHMGISLLIAFSISIIACLVMIKVFDRKMKFFKKLILTDSTSTESGYVSNQNRTELLDLIGSTLTDLRPSGTVIIQDERIDVVSEGAYIPKGTEVKIIKVEGSRIVVRKIKDEEKGGKQ
jgi:membrane-bound serine protease (ClpP class)